MKKLHLTRKPAFSLVEVAFALGLCAFCLLAIFGLLPVGLKSSRAATEETAAASLLSMVAADLRETPVAGGSSAFFQVPVPGDCAAAPAPAVRFFNEWAQGFGSAQPDSRYRLTVSYLSNGGCGKMPALADVRVTWPAEADPAGAAGCVRTLIAINRD